MIDPGRLAKAAAAVETLPFVRTAALRADDEHHVTVVITVEEDRPEEVWGRVFDVRGRSDPAVDPMSDVRVWTDSATGEPHSPDAMREWLASTIERLLALSPRRVLDVGCGSGLVLWRLAPFIEQYIGIDASRVTVDTLRRHLSMAGVAAQVRVGTAADLGQFSSQHLDTIVINSVVQYFPSFHYATDVLRSAIDLVAATGSGFVFLGDVRSLPLLLTIHRDNAARALSAFDEDPSRLEATAALSVARDPELALHPAAIISLVATLAPDAHVEIWPRRGRIHSEMTRYRFDALIEIGGRPVTAVNEWWTWTPACASADDLVALALENERVAPVGVLGVPNARIPSFGEETPNSLDPEDIWSRLADVGWEARLSWAVGRSDGSFDVVLLPPHLRHQPVAWPVPTVPCVSAHEPKRRARANERRAVVETVASLLDDPALIVAVDDHGPVLSR